MTRCTLTFLLCVCASFFLNAQQGNEYREAVMTFAETEYDCDTVLQGEMVGHRFQFVNTGKQPLIISEVLQSYYYPDTYQKEPVAPGDSGFIVIRLNTSYKSGPFVKTVAVKSNSAGGDVSLTIRGYIKLQTKPDAPVMIFDSSSYWFDTITPGTIIRHEYRFTNTGDAPLIITNVVTGCGCLVPEWPKEPIPPGGTGIIRLTFNSTGKAGAQNKTATISCNTAEGQAFIHIKGYVAIAPENQFPRPAAADKSGR